MSTKMVLIVDDIPLMRTMLTKFLALIEARKFARVGCALRIVEARDGAEALEAIRAHPIDLIFLDLMMPGMDGITFLERRGGDPRHAAIPVIVTTALAEEAALARARDLGAKACLHKPYTLDAIEAELCKCILPGAGR